MKHCILTCRNHPELRWSCKDIAFTPGYGYNGSRTLRFDGIPTGEGMYSDGSGLHTTTLGPGYTIIRECECKATDLILAPENDLVR